MNITDTKERVLTFLKRIIHLKRSYDEVREAKLAIKQNSFNACKLSKDEEGEIMQVWGKFKFNKSFLWHRFYKDYHGCFNELYVPSEIFFNYFEKSFNNWSYSISLGHKGILNKIIPEKNTPKTIVNNINNSYFTNSYKLIEYDKAVNKLLVYDKFVIKPSIETGGGKNVQIVDISKLDNEKKVSLIKDFFKVYKKDFIVQEVINQTQELQQFNPDSLNTIRLMSLNINNKVSVLSAFLRIGAKGMVIDNLSSGGMFVGINSSGQLKDYALNRKWERIKESPSGIKFKNQKINSYDKIVNSVKVLHASIPLVCLIAWDITIDKQGEVIIVEINLNSGNPVSHQCCNGPLFKERTKEVIDYVLENQSKPSIVL